MYTVSPKNFIILSHQSKRVLIKIYTSLKLIITKILICSTKIKFGLRGSTGAPKGIVHSTAGYMVTAYYTTQLTFDAQPATDILWTTAG